MIVDTYSRYPEISLVPYTKFETLRPVLEEVWSHHGYPETIIHDGGPPHNSSEWSRYVEEIGCKMDQSTLERPKANGMCNLMIASLVKIIHAGISEENEPSSLL